MEPQRAGAGGEKRKIPSETIYERPSKESKKEENGEVPNIEKNLATSSQEQERQLIKPLPQEVLSLIFSYMSPRERKRARSVCKNWFHASNRKEFLMTERFLCCAYRNTDIGAVIQTLESSQRVILDLVFRGINFNTAAWSSGFWIECGPTIRSLKFVSCNLSDEVLELTIQHCDQLVSLVLIDAHFGEGQPDLRSGNCLEELIASKVNRKSLERFEIRGLVPLSNNFLRALFMICPNIKHLRYSIFPFCEVCETSASMAVPLYSHECAFGIILKKLIDSQKTLESFSFGDPMIYRQHESCPSKFWNCLTTLQFPNLKEIRVLFRTDSCRHSSWSTIDFFSRHEQLEAVEWLLPISVTDALMKMLLEKCPRLKSLKLYRYRSLQPTSIANLNKLDFTLGLWRYSMDLLDSLEKTERMPGVNKTLKTLSLKDDSRKINLSDLLRNFRGVTKLKIDCPLMTDASLRSIIKYQRQLVDLVLHSRNLTDYGFTGIPNEGNNPGQLKVFPIKKLKKLERLKLLMVGHENWKITEKTLAVLKFPNLKYLAVRVPSEWEFAEKFLLLIPTFSKLEFLSLVMKNETIDRTVCLKLCSQLKWLKDFRIRFKEGKNFDEETYKSVFKCCPSLRFFCFKSDHGNKLHLYYYDVVTQNVVIKEGDTKDDDDEDWEWEKNRVELYCSCDR